MPYPPFYVDLLIELAVVIFALAASRWRAWQRIVATVEARLRLFHLRLFPAIGALIVVTVLIRFAFLWLTPIPMPLFHDEFSYLLGADTFAHGRLSNPTPLIPAAFETIHVNMWPTYQSMYMPGNALLLTAGHLLGLPWISVLFITSLFCGAVYWMVVAWLPSRYALAAALVAIVLTQSMNGWWDNYFCIGLPAMGGLLVLGAAPRILRGRSLAATLPLGIGLVLLILTRPFEGFCVCFPTVAILVWQLLRVAGLRKTVALALPPAVLVAVTLAWLLFYNWRGTGNAFLAPYMLNYRDYHITGAFLFSPNQTTPHYHLDIMRRFYTGAEIPQYEFAHQHPVRFFFHKVSTYYFAYIVGFGVLLVAGLCHLLQRAKEPLLLAPVASFAGFMVQVGLAAWAPFPQYAAPAAALFLLLIAYGLFWLRHAKVWRLEGVTISRGLVLAELALCFSIFGYHLSEFHEFPEPQYVSKYRAVVEQSVLSYPGKQLVMVRYTPGHEGWQEWVFNGADLQNERLLWARSLDPQTDAAVLAAYPGRQVWLVKPDYPDDLLGAYVPFTTVPLPDYVPKQRATHAP